MFFPFSSSDHSPRNCYLTLLQSRSIFSTTQLHGSWMDKIKGVITGKKSPPEGTEVSSESFTLLRTPHFSSLAVAFLQLHDFIHKHGHGLAIFNFFFIYLFFSGFADELKNARRVGAFKQYIVGRSSEATFADAFEKQEAIIRYLGGFDSTGEVGIVLFFFNLFCNKLLIV